MKKRPLGQNFLIDPSIAQNIIQLANIQPNEHVVEIGPGKGVLTQLLIQQADSLTAIELDPKLCRELQNRFSGSPAFKLIEGDAAKFDYGSMGTELNIVSNLPYYAATHIMKKLIHYRSHIHSMTLMLQKEVAERIINKDGKWSKLSVMCNFYATPEYLFTVSKSSFLPEPKVESAVIKFKIKTPPQIDQQKFWQLVKVGFSSKRRTLINNLASGLKIEKEKAKEILENVGLDQKIRAEKLEIEDWINLSSG